jgi:hypothetical protein
MYLEPVITEMKKLSILMLLLAMAFPFGAKAATQTGDVNGDGKVSIADVTTLINYLLTHEWPATQVDEYVDLGLGSGTLWATHNLGAINPEDYGDYFAWGETVPNKDTYTWATTAFVYYENGSLRFSKYNTDSQYGEIDNKTELDPEDDAAYVNWGPQWRMPSVAQIDELLNQCTWQWTEVNGVKGRLLTGPNGNTLFLPAAGQRSGANLSNVGTNGIYWTRELYYVSANNYRPMNAFRLYFSSGMKQKGNTSRNYGYPVRPVYVPGEEPTSDYEPGDCNFDGSVTIKDVTALINYLLSNEWPDPTPVEEYVDLGLPTGTLWAKHNVGANKPEAYGGYFAWGETEPKESYTGGTYKWAYTEDGKMYYTKYNTNSANGEVDNKTELDPEDDSATVNMGSEWRMPTIDEITELIENCTWEWTKLNGVNGYQVTGPNGNSIFLPASGESAMYSIGLKGYYWTRSMAFTAPSFYFPTNGANLYFASDLEKVNGSSRFMGCTVRAVRVTE